MDKLEADPLAAIGASFINRNASSILDFRHVLRYLGAVGKQKWSLRPTHLDEYLRDLKVNECVAIHRHARTRLICCDRCTAQCRLGAMGPGDRLRVLTMNNQIL